METIQGPLLNPRRLEEALKASKFGRRLLGFFQPLNLRFSAIKRTKVRRLIHQTSKEVSSNRALCLWHSPICDGSALVAHSWKPYSSTRMASPSSWETLFFLSSVTA